jgi:hypothetical protein
VPGVDRRSGCPEHYATYFLDPHGFTLEVVCHRAEEA